MTIYNLLYYSLQRNEKKKRSSWWKHWNLLTSWFIYRDEDSRIFIIMAPGFWNTAYTAKNIHTSMAHARGMAVVLTPFNIRNERGRRFFQPKVPIFLRARNIAPYDWIKEKRKQWSDEIMSEWIFSVASSLKIEFATCIGSFLRFG